MQLPVYLYVKRHNDTGLRYFGRTLNPDSEKYNGSGVYWRRHLASHGKNIATIMFEKFDNEDDLLEFASFFSSEFNVVESSSWANLIEETGEKLGTMTGFKFSDESKRKMSESRLGKPLTEDTKYKMSESKKGVNNSFYGKTHTEDTKEKISESKKGKPNNSWNTGLSKDSSDKLAETGNKISKALSGYRWWTNGIENVKSKIEPAEGWYIGRVIK